MTVIYLDAETSHGTGVCLLGVMYGGHVRQLVGEEITAKAIRHLIPPASWLYTFNGSAFDLPVIHEIFGVDLAKRAIHVDLRWICMQCGYTGGQKKIEKAIKFKRRYPLSGSADASNLFARYLAGDEAGLLALRRYNQEDLLGMYAIKRYMLGNARR